MIGIGLYVWERNSESSSIINNKKPIAQVSSTQRRFEHLKSYDGEIEILNYQKLWKKNAHVCEGLFPNVTLSQAWAIKKKQHIQDYLLQIDRANISRPLLNDILKGSGIGEYKGIEFLRKHNTTPKATVMPKLDMGNLYSGKQSLLANELYNNHDVEGLVTAYENNNLPTNKWYVFDEHPFPLTSIGMLLKTTKTSIGLDQTLLYSHITRLLRSGAKVSLLDLVTATEFGVSEQILNELLANSDEDFKQVFFYKEDYHSLVTFALAEKNVDAFSFWVNQSGNLNSFRYRDNVLDIIASNGGGEFDASIVKTLLDYGMRPNNDDTLKRLATWLPKNVLTEYADKLSFSRKYYSNEERKLLVDALSTVTNIVLSDSNEIGIEIKRDSECRFALARRLVKQVFSTVSKSASPATVKNNETEKLGEHTSRTQEETLKEKVDGLRADFLTDAEIIAKLAAKKDLEGKEAARLFMAEALLEQEKERMAKLDEDEAKRNKDLIDSGKLAQFIDEKEDDIPLESQDRLDAKITLAILSGDKDLFLTLLELGANVEPRLIGLIIQKFDVQVIDSLYKNGMNLGFIYAQNINSVVAAVENRKINILRYLLNIGISLKPSEFGYDPLDLALLRLRAIPTDLKYVDLLINSDAPIEKSHREIVESFFEPYQDTYFKLINRYPSLRS